MPTSIILTSVDFSELDRDGHIILSYIYSFLDQHTSTQFGFNLTNHDTKSHNLIISNRKHKHSSIMLAAATATTTSRAIARTFVTSGGGGVALIAKATAARYISSSTATTTTKTCEPSRKLRDILLDYKKEK